MTLDIDTVLRDHKIKGDIHSGAHEVDKPEFRALLKQIQNSGGQAVTRNTLAALNGVTPPTEDYMGVVLTGAEAGYYYRSGAAWVFGRAFPDSVAMLVSVGGTADAVTASTQAGVDPSIVRVFIIEPESTNTGAVTLSINGASAKSVLDVNGNALTPGLWAAGRLIQLTDAGTEYRLLSDPDADGAAASAASSAAAAAQSAIDAQAGLGRPFDNKADAEAYAPITAPEFIDLAGYYAAGDGGGALYKKVASEPSHAGKFSITLDDGVTVVWYEIVGTDLSNRAFGAKVDGVTDDSAATQACVDYLEAKGGGIMRLPQGVHYWPMGSGVKLPEAFSFYTDEKQLVSVIGEGDGTIITQNKTLATDVPDHKSSTDCRNKAALVVPGPNSYYRGFRFRDCVVGMFIGARDEEGNSSVSHNTFQDIEAQDCGLGFAGYAPDNGIYYNRFIGLLAYQCQIGFKFDWDDDSTIIDSAANVNRNTFIGCEATRCWVGFWGEAAGTNKAYGSHFEGNIGTPTNNRYPSVPSGDLPGALVQPCAIYMAPLTQSNGFYGCVCEANTTDVYNEGYRNEFEGDIAQAKSVLVRLPALFRSSDLQIDSYGYSGTIFRALVSEPATLQGQAIPAGWEYQKAVSPSFGTYLDQGRKRQDHERGRINKFNIDAGSFAAGQTKDFVLQTGDNDPFVRSGAGSFNIEVVGRTTDGVAYHVAFACLYSRAANGSLTSYNLVNKVGGYANGIGTGGADDLFAPVLTSSGTQLILRLVPVNAMSGAVIFVEEHSIKNVTL